MSKTNKMGKLYNYVFWYNEYQDLWYAIERNTENDFFNGNRKKSIYYKSTEHSTLVELLTKESVFEKYNQVNK